MIHAKTEDKNAPIALLADDDSAIRNLLSVFLEGEGYQVHTAADGRAAMQQFRRVIPDVILTDMRMPELHGTELCTGIRAHSNGQDTPILVITGFDDNRSIEDAYRAGATDFITKPINLSLLRHRLRYALRNCGTNRRLRDLHTRNRALLDAIPDMILRLSHTGDLLDANARDGVAASLIHGLVRENAAALVPAVIEDGESRVIDIHMPLHNEVRYLEARLCRSGDQEVLAVIRDITARVQAEEEVHHLAYTDQLTGLPNRAGFLRSVKQDLESPSANQDCVVLCLDLDHFKRINEKLSQTIGDQLLSILSDRLQRFISEQLEGNSDVVQDSDQSRSHRVARLDGDEFGILIRGRKHVEKIEEICARILADLSEPVLFGNTEVSVSGSIGIAYYANQDSTAGELIRKAELAMHQVKQGGRNGHCIYQEEESKEERGSLSLAAQLRKAITRDELELHYQPQWDIASNTLVGMEALVRWNHSEHGQISPARFIPIAEETGLILPIGEWVMATACAQARSWQKELGAHVRMGINVSGLQFRRSDLLETLSALLTDLCLDPDTVELEITESVVMRYAKDPVRMLSSFKDLGLRLAIDDFCTGYSSRSYLKRFPVDTLKIDRSFVRELPGNPHDNAIVRAIMTLADNMQLDVIAEGVETMEQLNPLRCRQGTIVQGYLTGRPVPANDCISLLRQGAQAAALAV